MPFNQFSGLRKLGEAIGVNSRDQSLIRELAIMAMTIYITLGKRISSFQITCCLIEKGGYTSLCIVTGNIKWLISEKNEDDGVLLQVA